MGFAVLYSEYVVLVMFGHDLGGQDAPSMSHFTQSEASADEPGWYVDPSDARLHRYWTGSRWLTADESATESSDTGPSATPAD